MGSENSKSSKNTENIVVAQEALKFGPPIGSSSKSQHASNQNQPTQPSTKVNPQQAFHHAPPPPVYSKTDPLQANYNARISQNIQQTRTIAQKTGSQIADERSSQNFDFKNKQTTANETGNAAHKNKAANQQHLNQTVYTSPDQLKHANKSKAPSVPPPSLPNQVQSPAYDEANNRYVWTSANSPDSNKSSNNTIDFDRESQKNQANVLSGNDVGMAISRDLSKNKSLGEVRKLLVNNEYLSDVRFTLNSIVFHGHKLFLVTASSLFYQHFQINGLKEMKVEGIDEGIFLAMLSFCYTGILHKLTDDNILSTLLAADKLKIAQAYTTCCGFITTKINPDGVFVVFEKAIDLNSEQFQKKCLDYIQKNEAKCFSSKGFFKIPLPSLMTMLGKCNYPSEKFNEIVEKWSHGPTIPETKNANNPAGNQTNRNEKGAKKKANPQNQQQQQQQQIQRNQQQQQRNQPMQQQQQNPQQQQKHRNQQQPQRNQQNLQQFQQQQRNPQNLQQFQQQQRNQQQQSSKNPKHNEGQKAMNRQQQIKKFGAGNAGNPHIPNLIDLEIPPPPFVDGFQSNFNTFPSSMRHADSMSNLSDDLMSFGGDDDDRYKSNDDLNGLVCVDDDEGGRVRVNIKGMDSMGMTEFARIDFVARRSFLLHEVWFNENMIENSNEIRISIAVFEGENRSDIHSRSIKGVSIKRCNFIKFTRQPLKIFVGQKFFIKLNFSEPAMRKHLDPQNLSSTDFLELRRDDEVRKYFNCINKLVVSEMA